MGATGAKNAIQGLEGDPSRYRLSPEDREIESVELAVA